MGKPVLKFPAGQDDASVRAEASAETRTGSQQTGFGASLRRYRRPLLLVVLPLIAVAVGLYVYLSGGRYVTTDNAYIGAQKVLITPDISGKISTVVVKEGETVTRGAVMFEIDPVPFRLALAQAEAKVAKTATELANLKSSDAAIARMIALTEQTIELRQRDVERKTTLVQGRSGSQVDLDTSIGALVSANNQLEQLRQQQASTRNQLLGDSALPLEKFPPYMEESAARDQAQRDLDHTRVRAPIDGVATQVDNIQIGRYVAAGTPMFSVIDVAHPWVDANPKESDFTWLKPGQPVSVTVDAFPGHVFKATVGSLSPGTGAQFAILPPQNATGNFVKIVQRVPVRINFDPADPALNKLKAGMSSYVTIDTGHQRSLGQLLGLTATSAEQSQP